MAAIARFGAVAYFALVLAICRGWTIRR